MSNTPVEPIDEEIKKIAFQKEATCKMYLLAQICEIISLAQDRHAFKATEMSFVGAVFDKLNNSVLQAYNMAKNEVEIAKLKQEETPII